MTKSAKDVTESLLIQRNITEFRMNTSSLALLGRQLRQERLKADMSQRDLASRVGRNAVRISELERDLLGGRWGRDRLTLLVEICDALALEIILVPRASAEEVESLVRGGPASMPREDASSAFDDLFVDLSEDEDAR